MMRYAVISKGLSFAQLETEVLKAGAGNVKRTKLLGQVFCELDEKQADALSRVPGLKVKPVKEHRPDQVLLQEAIPPSVETLSDVFFLLRSYFTPPLSGTGLTVAVLDSGIRKTHEALQSKVIYEENFTESPDASDVFGHGTNVADVIAGGRHAYGERAGVSPGASVINLKVISDEGIGTDESVILGIDAACELAEQARTSGLWPTDEMYPNVINISFGAEDDGDPDNPVRVACRQASLEYGLDVIAAAGNTGPKISTMMLPACEPEVIAVGAIQTGLFQVWEQSSRGPTQEGETKPDFVLWGTGIEMAGSKADDDYITKSGTSFAAPILSGLTGLIWESGRRAYGEAWPFRWAAIKDFAPYFCVKPEGAPIKKDNAYGYGLPAMGSMLGEVAQVHAPVDQMTEMMGMVTMMLLMAGMVGGTG